MTRKRNHIVYPISAGEMKMLGLGNPLPDGVEYDGLIFTPYEINTALNRWRSRKHANPLTHPSRSHYVQTAISQQQTDQKTIQMMQNAYQGLQEDIEIAETNILTRISEKQDVEVALQQETQLRKDTETQLKAAEQLYKAQQLKTQSEQNVSTTLRKTIDRYEIRYRTLRNELPLNALQRFIGWLFRIC